ncbi:helix-turn-helix domain-containing protein [Malikia sp.]|uniref:helix-turn-helix domain-containing protein n=1 Tax=Malikia sp. TaxID=2070706 RepID=UPI002616A635|nr:helix-turn-helix domain-containing protein [Malikia sp.]MDD2729307.1 helix-turn-helix domain-containing protein [Malikia sp.]
MSATPRLSPRQARVLDALRPGHWVDREPLDRIAGSSNSPDVIWKLRRKLGQDSIDMELIDGTDRDGRPCRTGRYRLTEQGRARLARISTAADQGRAAA